MCANAWCFADAHKVTCVKNDQPVEKLLLRVIPSRCSGQALNPSSFVTLSETKGLVLLTQGRLREGSHVFGKSRFFAMPRMTFTGFGTQRKILQTFHNCITTAQ